MTAAKSIAILLCLSSIGCKEKISSVAPSPSISKLYFAVECENSANTNLRVSEFFPQDAKAIPCEDVTQGRVYYSDDQLKLKFFKKDFALFRINPAVEYEGVGFFLAEDMVGIEAVQEPVF